MKHTFYDILFHIKQNFLAFFGIFFAVIFTTYLILYIIDFYPEPETPQEAKNTEEIAVRPADEVPAQAEVVVAEQSTDTKSDTEAFVGDALPRKIHFDDLDKTVQVLNPASADLATQEAELQKGAIRHPHGADFSEEGNIVILGHSSYLPNVINKNYQAFNGIQKLEWGSIVRVYSKDKEYVYRVDKVYKATTDEVIDTSGDRALLTLVTCNVLAGKEDRYILVASLQEVKER